MSFFTPKLGIDLGTANTLVYVPKKGIVLDEPSVVAVSEQDNKILAVGGVIADYRVAAYSFPNGKSSFISRIVV